MHRMLALLALGAALADASAVRAQAPAYKQEYLHSFKGPPAVQEWNLTGPEAQECVHFEKDALRITLPAGYPKARGETGIRTNLAVAGDFEITMDFEILQEPEPADTGFGTRLTLVTEMDNPEDTHATLARMLNSKGITQYVSYATPLKVEGAPPKQRVHTLPAQAKRGRLRLVRAGGDVSYFATEGDGDFQLVQQYAVGTAPVKSIRIVGTTGGERASLDFRVHELRVRAESIPNLPSQQAAKGTLAVVGLVVMLVIIGLAVGFWLYRRRTNNSMSTTNFDS
jgi:hypothetical protein